MKRLLFAIVAILILFFVGWLTFSGSGDRASIHVETEEIREDTDRIIEETGELLEEAEEGSRELFRNDDERARDASPDRADSSSTTRTDGAEEPEVESREPAGDVEQP